MAESRQWYIRTGDGAEYGPTDMDSLVACARDGRIDATCLLSADQTEWIPAASFPELEIQWICETQDGQFAGPFHKDCVTELIKQGAFPATVRLYRPDDPKREAERIELSEKLAKSQSETAAERTKSEELAAQLNASQEAVAAAEAKNAKLADELKASQAEGKALSVSFAEAQRQSLDLATKLSAAQKAKNAEAAKVADLQDQIVQTRKQLAGARDSGSQLDVALKVAQKESSELSGRLAKSQSETVAERTKGEQLAAELGKSRQLVHALSLELKNSKAETVGEQARGRRLAADLQTAQKQAIGLTSRLDAASREMSAVRKKNDDLQTRLEDAEQKIKELQKPKKPKNPLMALFGKDSAADLSALEQAARRELSAMKRPRGAHPRPFKNSQSDIIDV